MSNIKFRLKQPASSETNNSADDQLFSFYQICQFPVDYQPTSTTRHKKYWVRKIRYNQNSEVVDHKSRTICQDSLNKFLEQTGSHRYVIYPTHKLDIIEFPSTNEIYLAQSQMLNN